MVSEQAHPPTAEPESPPGVVRKAVAASAIGNATEWFDYGIYAYGVTYISAAIFPGDTEDRDPARADDVRGLVPGPAARRAGLGSAGRPDRPQAGAGDHDPADGGATLCVGLVPAYAAIGFVGADPAGAPADGPGLLHRRRVRRRRDVHGGVRAGPQARLPRQLPRVRHARRLLARRAADARLLDRARRRPDARPGAGGCRSSSPPRSA